MPLEHWQMMFKACPEHCDMPGIGEMLAYFNNFLKHVAPYVKHVVELNNRKFLIFASDTAIFQSNV